MVLFTVGTDPTESIRVLNRRILKEGDSGTVKFEKRIMAGCMVCDGVKARRSSDRQTHFEAFQIHFTTSVYMLILSYLRTNKSKQT